MLSRLLKRHGFDEKLIERIQNLSIKTLKQLIVHPMGDMAADLDLSNEEYQVFSHFPVDLFDTL